VSTVRRRLDIELVRRGLAESRGRAAEAIAAGRVLVAGVPVRTAARRVGPGEAVALERRPRPYVSRGGEKLEGALAAFGLEVGGRPALDAGASTGGFTECLLRRGVTHVHAVDVGRGQLAWSLREDSRVTVLERVNVRHLEPGDLDGGLLPLAVADLSFISLVTVAPALARCTTNDARLVLLVKPQFEAGPARVPRGGVVRDPAVHAAVLAEVVAGLASHGLVSVDVTSSVLLGADGNREFFLLCAKRGTPLGPARLDAVAAPGEAG
jgi:23S rRNA (cytidine1920-2'-O)/16S rRNA (cytidine1409-2'-O)-methyltransferase